MRRNVAQPRSHPPRPRRSGIAVTVRGDRDVIPYRGFHPAFRTPLPSSWARARTTSDIPPLSAPGRPAQPEPVEFPRAPSSRSTRSAGIARTKAARHQPACAARCTASHRTAPHRAEAASVAASHAEAASHGEAAPHAVASRGRVENRGYGNRQDRVRAYGPAGSASQSGGGRPEQGRQTGADPASPSGAGKPERSRQTGAEPARPSRADKPERSRQAGAGRAGRARPAGAGARRVGFAHTPLRRAAASRTAVTANGRTTPGPTARRGRQAGKGRARRARPVGARGG
ncbi:hypothetical protein BJ973_005195 [Actinoplanes tereljensis]